MKNTVLTLTFLILFSGFTFSQTPKSDTDKNSFRKNAAHIDLGGWSFWHSLNYERRISLTEYNHIALGGGLMTIPVKNSPMYLVGMSANYLMGETSYLEIGVTPSLFFVGDYKEFYFSPRLGFRYESPRGFLFRIGTAPSLLTGDTSGLSMLSWGYVSFGLTF